MTGDYEKWLAMVDKAAARIEAGSTFWGEELKEAEAARARAHGIYPSAPPARPKLRLIQGGKS